MGEYLRNQYEQAYTEQLIHKKPKTNNLLFDKSYKLYRKETNMDKFKKILKLIAMIGGWIGVAIEELLKVL